MFEPSSPLLEVRELRTLFPLRSGRGLVRAVDGVSFQIDAGTTLGLIGESGCGKSTLGRSVLRLVRPTSGEVWFEGQEVTALPPAALRRLRRRMQFVFQDPYGSLNPRLTVGAALAEPLRIHRIVSRGQAERDRVVALLERVGLSADALGRYPHEFSGGQRQRIGIARALAVGPRFVVADEPVSALDVSVQAQVVNLLTDLQRQEGIAFLFIAHDLHVVEHVSQQVAVMYLGRMVEWSAPDVLRTGARHPYTQALVDAVPKLSPTGERRRRRLLQGEVPSPLAPPAGCHFHPRCPVAKRGLCDRETPLLREVAPGHRVACHLA